MISKHKLLLIGLLFITQIVNSGIKISSSVDRNSVKPGESITLILKVESDSKLNLPSLRLPSIPGFEIHGSSRSSRMSIINGTVNRVLENKFTLLPKKEGSLKIPSFKLKINKKDYTTNPITVVVKKGASLSNNRPGAGQSPLPDVFVEAMTDKKSYYLNEPILYTILFYNRSSLFSPSLREPSLSNLKKDSLPNRAADYQKNRRGKNYQVNELTYLYFPEKSGLSEFAPASIVFSRSFFEPKRQVRSPSTKVVIKDWPSQKNAYRAIGVFKIQSEIQGGEVQVNEALTFRVTISGKGNLRFAKLSPLKLDQDLEMFDPKLSLKETITKEGLVSTKVFDYLIIPRRSGTFTIPSLKLLYLDIGSGRIKSLRTRERPFNATQATGVRGDSLSVSDLSVQTDVSQIEEDITFIKTLPGFLIDIAAFIRNVLFSMMTLIGCLVIGPFVVPAVKKMFAGSHESQLSKDLSLALKDPGQFYSKLHTHILKYISKKKHVRVGELSIERLQAIFITSKQGEQVLSYIKYLENKKFAPDKDVDESILREEYQKAKQIMAAIKRSR
jgi:hypothetical protein